jgi:DNA-damage-inducible protein J
MYNILQGSDTMANTTNISIRMDNELKSAAEKLYSELGMNISTAFNIFVRQSLREGGIPFMITTETPNKETVAAMLEAERIAKDSSVKSYTDVDELIKDLNE